MCLATPPFPGSLYNGHHEHLAGAVLDDMRAKVDGALFKCAFHDAAAEVVSDDDRCLPTKQDRYWILPDGPADFLLSTAVFHDMAAILNSGHLVLLTCSDKAIGEAVKNSMILSLEPAAGVS